MLVLFSGPGTGEGGWKTKMAFLWPNGHPVKLSGWTSLSGEHTNSVNKIWKQNKTSVTRPLRKFLMRGEAWRPLAHRTSDWWFRNLSALFHDAAQHLEEYICGLKADLWKRMVSEFGDSMKMLVTSRKMAGHVLLCDPICHLPN